MNSSIKLNRIYHNGMWVVAEFQDCGAIVTLNKECLEIRIANYKEQNKDCNVEMAALAEINRIGG